MSQPNQIDNWVWHIVPATRDAIKKIHYDVPTLTSLTETGTVDKAGSCRIIGDLVFFNVLLTPHVASTLASTAGTTYIDNLPYVADDFSWVLVNDVTTFVSVGSGVIRKGTNKAYLPSIAATGDTISIIGWYTKGN